MPNTFPESAQSASSASKIFSPVSAYLRRCALINSRVTAKPGQRHRAVVEAVELVERNVGVADELHHAPEIGRLLVAPVKLLLAVAGEDEHRRAISADMEQRGGAVYRRLQRLDALGAARLEMRDDLPAERDDARGLSASTP